MKKFLIILFLAFSEITFSQKFNEISVLIFIDGVEYKGKTNVKLILFQNDSTQFDFEIIESKVFDSLFFDKIEKIILVLNKDSLEIMPINNYLALKEFSQVGYPYIDLLASSEKCTWKLEINHYPYKKASENTPDNQNPFYQNEYIEEIARELGLPKEEIVIYSVHFQNGNSEYLFLREINLQD